MPKKRKNNKKQATLLTYFKVNDVPKIDNEPKKEEESKSHEQNESNVASSMEAMSLDQSNIDNNAVHLEPSDLPTDKLKDKKEIEEEEEEDSEDEEIIVHRQKRKRKNRRVIEATSSEESDSTSSEIPFSVRLAKLKQVEQCDNEENNSIIHDEELNFLDKSDILQDRTRGKKVSRYSEALKLLSDRKSKLDQYKGEKGPIEKYSTTVNVSDSSDSDSSESDIIMLDSAEEEEVNDSDDLEGFVVDDDMIDGEKNAVQDSEMTMMMEEMPAEFTKARTLSFSKQVKIYLEYLVALSLNPNFDIKTNGRYKIAKNAVVRRVQSYKDSIVTSDVWLSSFKEAVDRYSIWCPLPKTHRDMFDQDFLPLCEACRSNKPASRRVQLYSGDIPSSITINLGSECYRKASLYHRLYHFELHMYNKVKKQVTKMILLSDRQLQQQQQQQQTVNDNNNTFKQQQISIIYNRLVKSRYIKKWRNYINHIFNTIIFIYNLRSQRLGVNSSSSSSDSDEDSDGSESDNYSSSSNHGYYSSSED